GNRVGMDLEAGCGGMSPVAYQMLAARIERFVKGEARNRSAGPVAHEGVLVSALPDRDQQHRSPIEFDETAGDDADDSGVPVCVRQDQRRRAGNITHLSQFPSSGENAPFEQLPLSVLSFEKSSQINCALLRGGCQKLDDQTRASKPARRVQSRG